MARLFLFVWGLLPTLAYSATLSEQERIGLSRTSNGPASSSVEVPRAYAEIEAGKDSSKVSLKIGQSGFTTRDPWQDREAQARFDAFSFEITAPVDKSDKDTDVANLDGLANSFTLNVKWTRFTHKVRLPSEVEEKNFCTEIGPHLVEDSSTKEAIQKAIEGCVNEFDSEAAWAVGPEWGEKHDSLHFADRWRILYGVQGRIGIEEFDYIDPQDFGEKTDDETVWSAEAFVGFSKPNLGLTYLGYRYDQGYKDKDKATICNPIENSSALSCESGPLGSPSENNKSVLYLEHRRHFGRVAISPRVSRDFEDDVTGIELPVYFWADKDGHLSGGVKAGWTTEDDDFELSLFIGSTFSFFD